VFDAYGTLFDVHSVIALCEQLWPSKGAALSQLWRAKQLEYTWQRSLMRAMRILRGSTEASLRYACLALGLPLRRRAPRSLMGAYLRLSLFPEVRDALPRSRLRTQTAHSVERLAGNVAPLVENTGLRDLIGTVISVDQRKIYKPAPAVYRLAGAKMRVPKRRSASFASNCWDACGRSPSAFAPLDQPGGAPVDELGGAPGSRHQEPDELPRCSGPRFMSASMPFPPMNFCSNCGAKLALRVPPGDSAPRHVCDNCGTIHYRNPLVVVGTIPDCETRCSFATRAIEPASRTVDAPRDHGARETTRAGRAAGNIDWSLRPACARSTEVGARPARQVRHHFPAARLRRWSPQLHESRGAAHSP